MRTSRTMVVGASPNDLVESNCVIPKIEMIADEVKCLDLDWESKVYVHETCDISLVPLTHLGNYDVVMMPTDDKENIIHFENMVGGVVPNVPWSHMFVFIKDETVASSAHNLNGWRTSYFRFPPTLF